MAMLKLSNSTVELLIRQPESGMGYQVIAYRDEVFVVFNATVAIDLRQLLSGKFTDEDLVLFGGNPDHISDARLGELRLFDNVELAFSDFQPEFLVRDVPMRSSEIVRRPPSGLLRSKRPHSYFRFCSYWKDKRVDQSTGNYLPGTYATTFTDLPFAPSGFAAVGRYALPSPASARYVFPIVTFDKPDLMGTAAPNYGQAGGGVEVLFFKGARNAAGRSFMISAG